MSLPFYCQRDSLQVTLPCCSSLSSSKRTDMTSSLIRFAVTLLWATVLCLEVRQSPSLLWLTQGLDESAEMRCEHMDASYYQMYWYRQVPGRGLQLVVLSDTLNAPEFGEFGGGKYGVAKSVAQEGSFTVKEPAPEDSGLYFCAAASTGFSQPAYFGNGTKLTVLDPNIPVKRPKVKVLPPSIREGCVKKKTNRTLVCVATGFYPDHITVFWKVNGVSVTSGVRTDDTALRDKDNRFYSITSRLRVSYRKWFDTRSTFTCLTSFYDGSEYQEDKDSIKGVNGGGMDREYLLKSGLTAKLSYSVFIAKSFLYGLFISAVVWKIRSSVAKRYD